VVKDIVSAVEYAKGQTKIDATSVYLVGTSGGGYTALVMAGREPRIWAGVSAWAAISDLKAWHAQCKKSKRRYYRDIVASCGGAPGDSPAVDKQYRDRSPVTYLSRAKGVRLHINTGIRDGHQGSVPISHSLLAFNAVAALKDRISGDDIRFMVEKAEIPKHLKKQLTDSTYGKKKPLLRRTSGQTTVTLFDGGHELIAEAALAWIQAIHKSKTARR
jgi:S-formylglutathione hydrolase FrmB